MPPPQLQAVLTRRAGSSVVLALACATAALGGCGAGSTTGAASTGRGASRPVPYHGETVDGYRFVYRPIVVAPDGYGGAPPTREDPGADYVVYFRLNKLLPRRRDNSGTLASAEVGRAFSGLSLALADVHRKPCYSQEIDLLHGETPPSRHHVGDLVTLSVYFGRHPRRPLSARVPLVRPLRQIIYLDAVYPSEAYMRKLGCTTITPGVGP